MSRTGNSKSRTFTEYIGIEYVQAVSQPERGVAGGRHPKEFIIGSNYYPWNTRNLRLNAQLINVDHSPVNSTFGFYTKGPHIRQHLFRYFLG